MILSSAWGQPYLAEEVRGNETAEKGLNAETSDRQNQGESVGEYMILKNSNIIVPAYDFNASEDKVLLLKGSATTITGNVNCHGTGSVYLKYLPEPSICIDCSFKKVKSSASQQLLYNYNSKLSHFC